MIKWGGGLITDKKKLCTPNLEVIDALSKTVKQIQDQHIDVVLVHGAGSFGHLRCKAWRINEGFLENVQFEPDSLCSSQLDGVKQVRKEMLALNEHICRSLHKLNISTSVFPPHSWVTGTGVDFSGTLSRFRVDPGTVAITFGDVVDTGGVDRFGILSGDDLVVRLSIELPMVQRLVFAIEGVDGLLKVPPDRASHNDLIPLWTSDMAFEGTHASEIDVTGGIHLKAMRGAIVAEHGIDVMMVNGGVSERIVQACLGQDVRGTKVVSKKSVNQEH